MQIKEKCNEFVMFQNLEQGSVFKFGNKFYIKTNKTDVTGLVDAVCLNNGALVWLDKTDTCLLKKDVVLQVGR